MGECIRGFGSDNHAGVHPQVMAALGRVNAGHVHSYGDDIYTEEAIAAFRDVLGPEAEVEGRPVDPRQPLGALPRFCQHQGCCRVR